MSWDDGLLGARASRPHQAWHSLGHLPHLDQPGTAPWLSFGLADAVPAHRVAACSIAPKLSGGQRDSMRAGRPRSQAMPSVRRCRADHSRKNGRSLMKMNHEWTRIDTNRPEDRWTSFSGKRHQHASATCALGVTMSWDDGFPGARASRPHQAWHSLGHLLHRNQPAAAPCLCFGRAHAVPAGRAVGCNIAGKLSGNRRGSMRAGRPRSQGCRPDGEVGGIRRATSQKAGLHPLGNSRLPASRAPPCRADHSKVKQRILMAYREQGPCPVNPHFSPGGCTLLKSATWRRNFSLSACSRAKSVAGTTVEGACAR